MKTKKVQLKKACCLLAVFSFVLNFSGFSQVNLVSNPSFEEYTNCPFGDNQVQYALGWNSIGVNSTPDYFNSCSLNFSTPNNGPGYQIPFSNGNAYCGFFSSYWVNPPYREYIGQKLNTSLDSGTKYYISFYVSLANYMTCGTNKIGILFSMNQYFYNGSTPIILNRANIYTDNVITDTLNWVKISDCFVADSAYEYFSIGNFFDNNITIHIIVDSSVSYCQSYYYLDNICVSTDSLTCNLLVSVKNEYSNNSFNIFPNPANNFIIMQLHEKNAYKTEIINSLGEIVYCKENDFGYEERVNVSNLPEGLYLVRIKTKNNILTQKLIINH